MKPPMQVIRDAAEVNRKQTAEMRAASQARREAMSKEAAARAIASRKARMQKALEDSNKVRHYIPRNEETDANMAKTEEMLRIKRERR